MSSRANIQCGLYIHRLFFHTVSIQFQIFFIYIIFIRYSDKLFSLFCLLVYIDIHSINSYCFTWSLTSCRRFPKVTIYEFLNIFIIKSVALWFDIHIFYISLFISIQSCSQGNALSVQLLSAHTYHACDFRISCRDMGPTV